MSDGAKGVQDAISENRRRSVRDIADITGLSLGSVHVVVVVFFLTTLLEMNKVCAQWVLRMLTSDERT